MHKSDHDDDLSNSDSEPLDEEILIDMDVDNQMAKQIHDGIAQAMWDDYQSILLEQALEENVVGSDVESDNSSDA